MWWGGGGGGGGVRPLIEAQLALLAVLNHGVKRLRLVYFELGRRALPSVVGRFRRARSVVGK